MKDAIVDIYFHYRLPLKPELFLTLCGKCGGKIYPLDLDTDPRVVMSTSNRINDNQNSDHSTLNCKNYKLSGKLLPTDRTVFVCSKCNQPYWENSKAQSPFKIAMDLSWKLYSMVEKGLAEKALSLTALKIKNEDNDITNNDWKKNINVLNFRNASNDVESFTNWNGSFKGTIDYIFVSDDWLISDFKVIPEVNETKESPTSNTEAVEHNKRRSRYNVVINSSPPNEKWASDHFICVTFITLKECYNN